MNGSSIAAADSEMNVANARHSFVFACVSSFGIRGRLLAIRLEDLLVFGRASTPRVLDDPFFLPPAIVGVGVGVGVRFCGAEWDTCPCCAL